MQKVLFLLCPTDCLEPVINNTFRYENYFYTSLGNSLTLDFNTITSIQKLITKHNIQKINFVLSKENKIISDALNNQLFLNIRGLKKLYQEISFQKNHAKTIHRTNNYEFLILSYYLNIKVKQLQLYFTNFNNFSIKIEGKIYNNLEEKFENIYSELLCLESYRLN